MRREGTKCRLQLPSDTALLFFFPHIYYHCFAYKFYRLLVDIYTQYFQVTTRAGCFFCVLILYLIFVVSYNTCTYCCYEHTHTLHLQETRYTSIVPIPEYSTINYNLHTQYKDFIMLCKVMFLPRYTCPIFFLMDGPFILKLSNLFSQVDKFSSLGP